MHAAFDLQRHGNLVHLGRMISAGRLHQVLLHVPLQGPDVPLDLPYERHVAVPVRQVGVHGDVVHAGAANHVGQRRRGCGWGPPPGRSHCSVRRRSGDACRWDEPLHVAVLLRGLRTRHSPLFWSGTTDKAEPRRTAEGPAAEAGSPEERAPEERGPKGGRHVVSQ